MHHVCVVNHFLFKGLTISALQWTIYHSFIAFMEKQNKVSAYILYQIIDFDNKLLVGRRYINYILN